MSVWPGEGPGPWVPCSFCHRNVSARRCRFTPGVTICNDCFPKMDLRLARQLGYA